MRKGRQRLRVTPSGTLPNRDFQFTSPKRKRSCSNGFVGVCVCCVCLNSEPNRIVPILQRLWFMMVPQLAGNGRAKWPFVPFGVRARGMPRFCALLTCGGIMIWKRLKPRTAVPAAVTTRGCRQLVIASLLALEAPLWEPRTTPRRVQNAIRCFWGRINQKMQFAVHCHIGRRGRMVTMIYTKLFNFEISKQCFERIATTKKQYNIAALAYSFIFPNVSWCTVLRHGTN